MEKIKCNKCGEWKFVENFSKSNKKRGYHSWCKSCVKEYDSKRYKIKRKDLLEKRNKRLKLINEWCIKSKNKLKCENCGEEHVSCLEFHHLNEEQKDFNISTAVKMGYSIERLKNEMDKCVVLCSNCHRKLHYNKKHNSQWVSW